MKRMLFVMVSIVFALPMLTNAQLTLEKTYSGVSAGVAQTETYGSKYYVMDVSSAQCKIYNLDHSLWKTITLSVPSNYYLYDIQYVTDHLFNSDNSIELLYVCYNYNSTGQYYTYETRVVTETGAQLLALPGAGYNWITDVAGAGTKLFSYIYDYSVSPYTVTTKVYAIPGNLPSVVNENLKNVDAKAWPNPVSGSLNIEFDLPKDVPSANLIIRNLSGQVVRSFHVDGYFGNLMVDASGLASGTYFWSLEGIGLKTVAHKLIVSH